MQREKENEKERERERFEASRHVIGMIANNLARLLTYPSNVQHEDTFIDHRDIGYFDVGAAARELHSLF